MLKKTIHHFVKRRHPWRKFAINELVELYISMSLRSFGLGIVGIFVPFFLYQNGVSLQNIFLFFGLFFLFRIPLAYGAGFVVGRVGPKHGLAISTLVLVVFLLLLFTYSQVYWPLAFLAFVFSTSNALFFTAYQTDFSKIKDSLHGGKELGWLYSFEHLGASLGPIVGGLLGSFFSPLWTIGLAILVLGSSLIPLFLSDEPVKVHQKIKFRGFRWRPHVRNFVALSAYGVDHFATLMLWPLLMAVYIFTDGTYAKLGGIVGVSTFFALLAARTFGKIIDSGGGLRLLQGGTLFNAVTHALRALIATSAPAAVVTAVNEPTTLAYRMSLSKGFYDALDGEEGYRIVFITLAEMVSAFTKVLFCFGLYFACTWHDPITVMRAGFVITAFVSLGILFQKFPALKAK